MCCVHLSPAQSISVLWATEFPQHPQRKRYFLKGKPPQWRLMFTSGSSQATTWASRMWQMPVLKSDTGRHWIRLKGVPLPRPKSTRHPEEPLYRLRPRGKRRNHFNGERVNSSNKGLWWHTPGASRGQGPPRMWLQAQASCMGPHFPYQSKINTIDSPLAKNTSQRGNCNPKAV